MEPLKIPLRFRGWERLNFPPDLDPILAAPTGGKIPET